MYLAFTLVYILYVVAIVGYSLVNFGRLIVDDDYNDLTYQGGFLIFNHLNGLFYWIWCELALIAYLGDCDLDD